MNLNIKKINAMLLAFFPWISNYRFIIQGVTIGDICLILIILLSLYDNSIRLSRGFYYYNLYKILLLFIIYAVLITLISLLIGDYLNYINVLKRTLKLILYFTIILFIIPNLVDYDYFIRVYKVIVIFAFVAIILQYVGYYFFNVYIDFKLPLLKYSNDSVEAFNFSISRLSVFRPDSIFLEPAHFVFYAINYLPIVLFEYDVNSKTIFKGILITIVLLMSKSSTGVILLIFIWFYFLFWLLKNNQVAFLIKNKILILALILISIIIYIYINSDLIISVQRLMSSINETQAISVWNKIRAGKSNIAELSFYQKIFGVGLGNYKNSIFVTSINFLIYSTGYFGLIIFCLWIVLSYIFSNIVGKTSIIIMVLIFFSWYLVYSPTFLLYCVFIISNTVKIKTKNN